MLTITLPFKIIAKPNNYKKGKRSIYKPKDVHLQESTIKSIATLACEENSWLVSSKPIRVDVYACYKDKRRRDIDNILKGLLDCLNGIIYKDDSQILEIHVYKLAGTTEYTKVIVQELQLPCRG